MKNSRVLVALIVFGIIGSVAVLYGWRQKKPRALTVGVAMSAYPYFISSLILIWLIGLALTAALYFWRDE
jgi:hypothetical protein